MSKAQRAQKGQALILIVFAIIGLVGITGLAIDGGNAYSDRRNAQNAADTAALATGLTAIRHASDSDQTAAWTTAQQAGFDRAAANGYSNSNPSKVVHVYRCDQTSLGANCQLPSPLPSGDVAADYVQVTIRSTIPTYFAPVLGIRSMTNYVQAVARAVPPVEETWYDGHALVATMPGCKPNGWPDDAFVLSGGSQTNVFGISGVYVNANCPYSASFTASNNTYLHSPGICVKGTSSTGGADISPAPTDHCTTSFDVSKYVLPPVGIDSCKDSSGVTQMGHLQTISGKTYAYPGVYSGTFPPNGISGSTLYLYRGVYCLMNSPNALNWTGNVALSTDWNGNGNLADTNLEGVLFYVPNGGVTINTNMNMSAMEDSLSGALKGYLMYLPPSNTSTVSLAGSGSSTIVGTILAPAARVTISGGASGDSMGMESQVIGYSVGLSGGGALSITYNQSKNGKTWTPPMLQPYNNK